MAKKAEFPVRDWNYYKEDASRSYAFYGSLIVDLIDSKEFTPIEKITYYWLRKLWEPYGHKNLHITPQKKIGKYRVDFEIIHRPFYFTEDQPDLQRIVVECDGHDFHEKTKEQAQRDKERDRFLSKEGYTVLRFTGREIMRQAMEITSDIDALLDPEEYRRIQEMLKEDGQNG